MRYFVLFFLITVLCRTGIAQTPDFNDICKKIQQREEYHEYPHQSPRLFYPLLFCKK